MARGMRRVRGFHGYRRIHRSDNRGGICVQFMDDMMGATEVREDAGIEVASRRTDCRNLK